MPVVRQAFIFKSFYFIHEMCIYINFYNQARLEWFLHFCEQNILLRTFFLYNFDLNYVRGIIMILLYVSLRIEFTFTGCLS